MQFVYFLSLFNVFLLIDRHIRQVHSSSYLEARKKYTDRVRELLSWTPGSLCHLNTAVFCLRVIKLPVGTSSKKYSQNTMSNC